MKLVECVPNFSEGRRPEVVATIRDAIAAVPGVHIFDVSSLVHADEIGDDDVQGAMVALGFADPIKEETDV